MDTRRHARALWFLIPLLVLSGIWVPEFAHYYVPGTRISSETIEASRVQPADTVLREIERYRLGTEPGAHDDRGLVAAAEALLRGELRVPHYPPSRVTIPFNPADLETVNAPLQFASLIGVDILLDAHRLTGRDDFFVTARNIVSAFAAFEKAAWLQKGFLWNDHAIAARIPVLTKFWRTYRTRRDLDPHVATAALELLARSGQLLVKPSHFTFHTNHGVMQNVALLHLCVAFPEIPSTRERCETGFDRLRDQMRFYVNTEGVVLEHSAGYHAVGLELLGIALRHLTLLERPLPEEWVEKYAKAQGYFAQLRRPDGTLPMYGNTPSTNSAPLVTSVVAGRASPLHGEGDWRPRLPFSVLPIAGHAVRWSGLERWPDAGALSQTVVTWAHFAGHGHKLADEMSVLLWRDGQTWVTNSGYWPYEAWGQRQAEGWEGANAPHLAGEPKNSVRTAELLGYADDGPVTVLDLRRNGPAGYAARRQVIQLGSELWLVLDHVQDSSARKSVTTWTMDPKLSIVHEPPGHAYRLVADAGGKAMTLRLITSPGTEIRPYRGSRQPFAGWVVTGREPTPASAFTVEQPSRDSWAAALWSPVMQGGDGKAAAPPQMLEWTSAERWKLSVPLHRGNVVMQRADAEVTITDPSPQRETVRVAVNRAPNVSAQRTALRSAYEAARAQSNKYRNLYSYRLKISYLLIAILILQEAIMLVLRKRVTQHNLFQLRTALGLAWIGAGSWICLVYLRA